MDQSKIAETWLKQARPKADQAEIFISTIKQTRIDVLAGKVEAVEETEETGLAVRLIAGRKLGFAYTSELSAEVVEETISLAAANSLSTESDDLNLLPLPSTPAKLDLFDPQIPATPLQNKIDLALRAEAAAFKNDKRVSRTEKVSYFDSAIQNWIVNSNGVNVTGRSNHCGLLVDVVAIQAEEMESGFGIDHACRLKDLDPEKVGSEAAAFACQLLGGKPISSQVIPLIFDPRIGAQLLQVLSSTFSAEAAQKGRSLFAGRLGKKVGRENINIIDNGQLTGGIASFPFDAEGVNSQETRIIESGNFARFLHTTYTAAKDGTTSTGNAGRASFKSLPQAAHTNLYFSPGSVSRENILKSQTRALYITRVMGLHTANPITGDFSFGAAGMMIEGGELTSPVRGITIAGNLIAMLQNIEMIGSDLRFFGDIGSPTLLITGLSVSGA